MTNQQIDLLLGLMKALANAAENPEAAHIYLQEASYYEDALRDTAEDGPK